MKVYRELATKIAAIRNCQASGNSEWESKHREALASLVRDYLPSGSGWDNGTTLDELESTSERLVFTGSFHHMNDGGMYDGWTDHTVTVTASLLHGVQVKISGRNRNGIKDYLGEVFDSAMQSEFPSA